MQRASRPRVEAAAVKTLRDAKEAYSVAAQVIRASKHVEYAEHAVNEAIDKPEGADDRLADLLDVIITRYVGGVKTREEQIRRLGVIDVACAAARDAVLLPE